MNRSPWQIQKSVIFALFIRELRTRFTTYKGGYIWMLVEPLAHVVVMSLIFTYIKVRTVSGMSFPVFLVTGVVPFLLFQNIALHVMEGLNLYRALFNFRQLKPVDTFFARALVDSFQSGIMFFVILIGMAWIGLDVPFGNPVTIIFIFMLMILNGLGLGMVLCVVTHYLPESKTFIRLGMMPLYLLSGVIIPISGIPQEYLSYLMWNPFLHAIEILRGAFFVQYTVTPGVSLLYVVMTTLVVFFFGFAWYRINRHDLLATA